MPNPGQTKKKKGHAPAHQNKFAFAHNPKSKTTAKILASPNIHVCRRCHEKIEWRKQYRKYKPRTQPGTCNGCKKRNVLAAYHTICESCTRMSVTAKAVIEAYAESAGDEPDSHTTIRACAVCVKEVALPDPDEDDEGDAVDGGRRLRLRERRTLERQQMREANASNKNNSPDDEEEEEMEDLLDHTGDLSILDEELDDEEDPFLKAVGGANKLLTGKAYQQKLLATQQQQQQS
eukprot:Nitzschia sp. Nitz4//scaffold199_size41809//10202//10903//NITZ4_007446-RA/size41809-processed-gene-0.49-mRNA-1//1//CDS//3329540549//134//frame0